MAAVILGGGLGRDLYELLAMLERQVGGAPPAIVVDTGDLDLIARRVLATLGEREGVEVVRAKAASTPGAWRNAGIRATTAEILFFVEPGYRLDPGFCSQGLTALANSKEPMFATTWWSEEAGGGESRVIVPPGCDLESVLAQPEALHPSSLFRRSLWESLGGFDEGLESFELYDFWIRALSRGFAGTVVEEALVAHSARDSRHRRGLERARHLPAMNAIFAKHRELFEAHPATVLVSREAALCDLAADYQPILERRRAAEAEVARLNVEIRQLTSVLRQHGAERVDWGDLRRTTPISPEWGRDRGKPVDRYYIEAFLGSHSEDIRGAVLEVQEGDYTRSFGGERVERSDVLDVDPTNPRATVVADLRQAEVIPADSYDCLIITQTLHIIDDMRAALEECFRILRPGGVLLATFPCLSRVCLEYGADGDFWRLTEAGVRGLLSEVFPLERVETRAYGNVLVATAFLHGLSCEELTVEEFEDYDPFHPVLIGVRAVKGQPAERLEETGCAAGPALRHTRGESRGLVLGYHRVATAERDVHGMCVPVAELRAQLEHLKRHYRPLGLTDLVARAQAGELPPAAVAITFDDGYADALTKASPILCELGLPATFFVTTGGLEGKGAFWWDSLERLFLGGGELPPSLEVRLKGDAWHFTTGTLEEREAAHWALYRKLLRSPPAQRDEILRQLARWSGLDLEMASDGRPLHREEVTLLASREGHSIGGHTVHHLALSHQPFETKRREVMECKSALERLLGRTIESFAYPYGDFDPEAADLVRSTSFKVAVTCEEGLVEPIVDPCRLPRWTAPQVGGEEFAHWLRSRFSTPPPRGGRLRARGAGVD